MNISKLFVISFLWASCSAMEHSSGSEWLDNHPLNLRNQLRRNVDFRELDPQRKNKTYFDAQSNIPAQTEVAPESRLQKTFKVFGITAGSIGTIASLCGVYELGPVLLASASCCWDDITEHMNGNYDYDFNDCKQTAFLSAGAGFLIGVGVYDAYILCKFCSHTSCGKKIKDFFFEKNWSPKNVSR